MSEKAAGMTGGTGVLGYEVRGSVAVLTLANPPVNSLGLELRRAVVEALGRAEDDAQVKAVVVIGSGKGFSGGADIREFGTPKAYASPNLHQVLRSLEDCGKPVVAAIDGVCMGGGLEFALACHYRVAPPTRSSACRRSSSGSCLARVARSACRAWSASKRALNMIVSGNPVRAEELRGTAALSMRSRAETCSRRRVEFARAAGRAGAGTQARARPQDPDARRRGLPAVRPHHRQGGRRSVSGAAGACVEAVAAAVKGPFDAGMARERELFVTLMASPESAALRHVFQAERAAAASPMCPSRPRAARSTEVGVIGAGTMGGGITMSAHQCRHPGGAAREDAGGARPRAWRPSPRTTRGSSRRASSRRRALAKRLALITPTLEYARPARRAIW